MAMVSLKGSINEINNEKVYATKATVSGANAQINLSSIANPISVSGETVCRASGISQPLLVLQGTTDFWYNFGTTTSSVVTNSAGASPGIFVKSGVPEYVRPAAQSNRVYLNLLQDSAGGVVVVSVAKFAGN